MKDMTIKTLLVLIFLALLVNALLLFMNFATSRGTVLNPQPAMARVPSTYYYTMTEDTYIVTSDTSGENVYLYFFEAGPKKEDSKIYYLLHTRAQ